MFIKRVALIVLIIFISRDCFCWGFYAHKKINYQAVFLLPPELIRFYKTNIDFISEHAVDPDMRRYVIEEEGSRHFIDMDHYGTYPYPDLPRHWNDAVAKFTEDSLKVHGIVPWWIQVVQRSLIEAFKQKNAARILKLSADLGHYISDAHVPLHTCSNYNGQHTNQKGIHGFWESRVPELLAEKEWDFFIGKAAYIKSPSDFIWKSILESAAASDTVLLYERELTASFASDRKYAYETRNEKVIRQYSTDFTIAYDRKLKGMVERRMRASIYAIASFWYTAWVDAGQPDLSSLTKVQFSEQDEKEFKELQNAWRNNIIQGSENDH